jgi:hypothetical protein
VVVLAIVLPIVAAILVITTVCVYYVRRRRQKRPASFEEQTCMLSYTLNTLKSYIDCRETNELPTKDDVSMRDTLAILS